MQPGAHLESARERTSRKARPIRRCDAAAVGGHANGAVAPRRLYDPGPERKRGQCHGRDARGRGKRGERETGDSVGDYLGVVGGAGLGSQGGSIAWGGNGNAASEQIEECSARTAKERRLPRPLQIKALEMFFIAAEQQEKSVEPRRAAEMSLAIAADKGTT